MFLDPTTKAQPRQDYIKKRYTQDTISPQTKRAIAWYRTTMTAIIIAGASIGALFLMSSAATTITHTSDADFLAGITNQAVVTNELGGEIQLATIDAIWPQICYDAQGNLYVAYFDSVSSNTIALKKYDALGVPDTRFGNTGTITLGTSGAAADTLSLVSDPSDNLYVTWYSSTAPVDETSLDESDVMLRAAQDAVVEAQIAVSEATAKVALQKEVVAITQQAYDAAIDATAALEKDLKEAKKEEKKIKKKDIEALAAAQEKIEQLEQALEKAQTDMQTLQGSLSAAEEAYAIALQEEKDTQEELVKAENYLAQIEREDVEQEQITTVVPAEPTRYVAKLTTAGMLDSSFGANGILSETSPFIQDTAGIYYYAWDAGVTEHALQTSKHGVRGDYYTAGVLTSDTIDVGMENPSYDTVSWSATLLPATSVKLQFATDEGNNVWAFRGPDGSPDTYYTNLLGEDVWSGIDGIRYLRYRLYLTTTDIMVTPRVEDITIALASNKEENVVTLTESIEPQTEEEVMVDTLIENNAALNSDEISNAHTDTIYPPSYTPPTYVAVIEKDETIKKQEIPKAPVRAKDRAQATSASQEKKIAITTPLEKLVLAPRVEESGKDISGYTTQSTTSSPRFTKDLALNTIDDEVVALQQCLNASGITIASTGYGSPGNETNFYGFLTYNAVVRFQEMYASSILQPFGLIKGTGFFGPRTREHLDTLCR